MQLNKKCAVSGALAMASQALINSPALAEQSSPAEWQFDTAGMYYGEDSDRVQGLEAMFSAERSNADDQVFSVKLTVDTLTGASPNGAVAQPGVQTFTSPSGSSDYTVAAGEVPLDDTFRDTRVQLNLGWASPIDLDWDYSAGLHLSREYDYLSVGANLGLTRSLNQNNTELSLGLASYLDTWEPEGGLPIAGTAMALRSDYASEAAFTSAFNATRQGSSDDKTTTELTLGLSQVINRWWITGLNYSYSQVDGYLNDPFKLVSVVDATGITQSNLYEGRPDSRTKHAIYWQNKMYLHGQVLDIGYRYFFDDWDVNSHTVDLRYNHKFANGHYIEPHFRYYNQTAAEFYRPFLNQGEALPEYYSADYRLGKMDALTLGLKYGMPVGAGDELAFRLEYYVQQPKNAGFDAPGQLAGLELYPEITAIIAQINYHF